MALTITLGIHGVVVAGFLQVRAQPEPEPAQATVQVAFVEGEAQPVTAPPQPQVALAEVRPAIPQLTPIDVPVVAELAPAPSAISVSLPAPAAPAAAPPARSKEGPVLVDVVDYLEPPRPRYPAKARRTRAEGTVLLQVLIDPAGQAREVKIHRSSGHEELDVAAREAVLAASFRPYLENGVARSALVVVPIEFALTVRTASR